MLKIVLTLGNGLTSIMHGWLSQAVIEWVLDFVVDRITCSAPDFSFLQWGLMCLVKGLWCWWVFLSVPALSWQLSAVLVCLYHKGGGVSFFCALALSLAVDCCFLVFGCEACGGDRMQFSQFFLCSLNLRWVLCTLTLYLWDLGL